MTSIMLILYLNVFTFLNSSEKIFFFIKNSCFKTYKHLDVHLQLAFGIKNRLKIDQSFLKL